MVGRLGEAATLCTNTFQAQMSEKIHVTEIMDVSTFSLTFSFPIRACRPRRHNLKNLK